MTVIGDALGVDPSALSYTERLELLRSIERERAGLDALQQRTLALLAEADADDPTDRHWTREEVAALLRLSPGTARGKLADATELVTRLPRTLDALTSGAVTLLHARVLIEAIAPLDDSAVATLEAWTLPDAVIQTVAEFRCTVRRAVLALDPRRAEERHRDALSQRRVRVFADDDGMATVWAYLRADKAQGLFTVIDAHARALPACDTATGEVDGRTMDEKRADVLADLAELALSAAPGTLQGQRPAVRVTVALSTLLGLDHQPAELDGHGPIPAGLARAIAADPTGTWRRLVTDDFGQLLDYGRTTYRPPANLRNHVVALYGRCTFPGCRRDARRAELDHVVPYPAGPTSAGNLHPACARHHHARHEGGWQVAKSPDHGVVWTSPSGRSYLTEPQQHPVDRTTGTDPDPPPF